MRRVPLLIAALLFTLPISNVADAKPRAKSTKSKAAKKKTPAEVKLRPDVDPPEEKAEAAPMPTRGPARIDFDDRLVQGQTNTSGAVYLYERKELQTRSMLQMPETFRTQTLQSVFGE